MFVPPGPQAKDILGSSHSFEVVDLIRKRLQLAETGQWARLYEQLQQAQEQAMCDMCDRFVQQSLGDEGGTEWIFSKTATKVRSSNVKAAKNILVGQVAARLDTDTAAQVEELVAEDVPPSEMANLKEALEELKAVANKTSLPKMAAVRRRLSLLNLGAEPGPSGQKNAHLLTLRAVQNG
eukprot:8909970-Karenia_brevis.AAC.1